MSEWISVEHRLPEKDIPVLCYYYDKYMDVMEYWYDDEKTGKPIFFNPPSPANEDVTHWMELPKPPSCSS